MIYTKFVEQYFVKKSTFCAKNRPRSYYAMNNCKQMFPEIFKFADYDSSVTIKNI